MNFSPAVKCSDAQLHTEQLSHLAEAHKARSWFVLAKGCLKQLQSENTLTALVIFQGHKPKPDSFYLKDRNHLY